MSKSIGILTAGGDSPGLNAAIRGIGKAAIGIHGFDLIGFRDGFRGLMENRIIRFDKDSLSGILTTGGTMLGTSRDKPHAMSVGGKTLDMRDAMLEVYKRHHLDGLVCLGGGGTQKNALRLQETGMNVITLPKTIDNDIARTDVSFGFDTAMTIATDALDRLHSTAHSHHRIIVVEIMGHRAGWLALGSGIAGGADVVLIPEIPYNVGTIAEAIRRRSRSGKRFSIVAVAEGAFSDEDAKKVGKAGTLKSKAKTKEDAKKAKQALAELYAAHTGNTLRLAAQLEELTGLESRLTILGHLQRGGTPSANDRLLASRLGTTCADLIAKGQFGVMVAARGDGTEAVPLAEVAGQKKLVPADHPWVSSARAVGTSLGD